MTRDTDRQRKDLRNIGDRLHRIERRPRTDLSLAEVDRVIAQLKRELAAIDAIEAELVGA